MIMKLLKMSQIIAILNLKATLIVNVVKMCNLNVWWFYKCNQ